MERLTIRNNVGLDVLKSPVVCGRCGEVDYSPITESGEDVAKRLAAYEDICFDADGKERITVEELSALVKARDEGRVVVLDMPRKPLVWGDDDHNTCLCPDCGEDLMGIPYGERMVLQCPACGRYLDATKVITRAEAETAQREEGQG